jgi:hypothetical protein
MLYYFIYSIHVTWFRDDHIEVTYTLSRLAWFLMCLFVLMNLLWTIVSAGWPALSVYNASDVHAYYQNIHRF